MVALREWTTENVPERGNRVCRGCWGRKEAVWITERHLGDNTSGQVLWILAVGHYQGGKRSAGVKSEKAEKYRR